MVRVGMTVLRLGALVLAAALGLVAPAGPARAAAPVAYAPSPVLGWHVDGDVYATAVVGDVVVIGGSFTTLSDAFGTSLPRANLAALSATTGQPVAGWVADTDGEVLALETDGTSVWAGGGFTQVQGSAHARVVKLLGATGAVQPGFAAGATGGVRALALGDRGLYLGGSFGAVNGVARPRLALVDPGSGALAPGFTATTNATVQTLAASPTADVVYVGGGFTTLDGQPRAGLGAVDSATGQLESVVFEGTTVTLGLDVSPDGSTVIGGLGGSGTFGNSAVAWDAGTGTTRWRHQTDGDVQAVSYHAGEVYFGFHDGYHGDPRVKLLAADAATGTLDSGFRPAFSGFWGIYSIATTDALLVAGGSFGTVNGINTPGVALFRPPTPPPVLVQYVAPDATWRVFDRGFRPRGWTQPGFDDRTWRRGRPEFGYGDGDEITRLATGPAGSPFVTAYFRVRFDVSELPETLTLVLAADDGAVVYLNGHQVLRDNMPSGRIDYSTLAASSRSGPTEDQDRAFVLDPGLLTPGTNTLAVELHQSSRHPRDASLAGDLSGLVAP